MSAFEDDYGAVRTIKTPRPEICSFLYSLLPLIDEHNRQRQHFLDVAGTWPTKDPWFRLLGEVVGICVVDFFKLAQFSFPGKLMRIVKFADMLSTGLVEQKRDCHRCTG